MDLLSPVTVLSGVGKTRAEKLAKLNIRTIRDLIYFFPRAYEKRGDVRLAKAIQDGEVASMILTVATEVTSAKIKKFMTLSKFRAFDESGSVEVVFYNSPYIKQVFHVGTEFRFYGKVNIKRGRIQLINPKYEPIMGDKPLLDFFPVYSLTEGITSKILLKLVEDALSAAAHQVDDYLPEKIRLEYSLPTLSYAITEAHFPKSSDDLSNALRRLAFDEMFLFALGTQKSALKNKSGNAPRISPCSIKEYVNLLPYELTNAQKRSVNEIYADLTRSKNGITPPMTRILVGDVGSGKTVCAALAVYTVLKSGYQCAVMAPTEILARQHYEDLSRDFEKLGYKVALLLGATTQKEKNRIYNELENGEISLVIGTHALLSDKVSFYKLGLVVTDEQHRFGVMQRAKLKDKADNVHLLVMSATPIPRTLALAMYGDIDVSKIDEMPVGRQSVDTHLVDETYRERLNGFIDKQAQNGGQVYVVCPAIEQNDEDEGDLFYIDEFEWDEMRPSSCKLKDATTYTQTLRQALPHLKIETLHGKMNPKQKDEIMTRYCEGEIDVLVSTTVIEVGINVPTATLMIVENAERFGLSQLHQLRGRVGRSSRKSYCILVSDEKSEKARRRMKVLCDLHDGFKIAEEDLLMRGPGDFFSNQQDTFRQSGGFQFKFAQLCQETGLFSLSFEVAKEVLRTDPDLCNPENQSLKNELEKLFSENSSTIS